MVSLGRPQLPKRSREGRVERGRPPVSQAAWTTRRRPDGGQGTRVRESRKHTLAAADEPVALHPLMRTAWAAWGAVC